MNATPDGVLSRHSRAQLAALLKVQAKLSLREPYGLGLGVGLAAVLLVVFGFISKNVPGNVGGSGLTVIDLYVPMLMVISFIAIAISLPNSLAKDREFGWLRRISTTPVHPSRLPRVKVNHHPARNRPASPGTRQVEPPRPGRRIRHCRGPLSRHNSVTELTAPGRSS